MNTDVGFHHQPGFEEQGRRQLGVSLSALGVCLMEHLAVLFEVSSQKTRHTRVQMHVKDTCRSQIKMTLSYYVPFCEKSSH